MQEEPCNQDDKNKPKQAASTTNERSIWLRQRKWMQRVAANLASVEVPVVARCSDYCGREKAPTGAEITFWQYYQTALTAAIDDVGYPVADSSAKPEKQIAIEEFHQQQVVPRMQASSDFRFAGPAKPSRQSPNGWADEPNLAGAHWGVYDVNGFVRHFGLDEA